MSKTTFDLTTLVASTTNDPADINANFNEFKTKLEDTGLGEENLKAKWYRFPITWNEFNGVPNATNGQVFKTNVPSGGDFIIESVAACVLAKTGNPDIHVLVDGNSVWDENIINPDTVYESAASPAAVAGGSEVTIVWGGAGVTGISGITVVIWCKQIVQES